MVQPLLAVEGGAFIGAMYGEEEKAQKLGLVGDALPEHRQRFIRPITDNFERWLDAIESSYASSTTPTCQFAREIGPITVPPPAAAQKETTG